MRSLKAALFLTGTLSLAACDGMGTSQEVGYGPPGYYGSPGYYGQPAYAAPGYGPPGYAAPYGYEPGFVGSPFVYGGGDGRWRDHERHENEGGRPMPPAQMGNQMQGPGPAVVAHPPPPPPPRPADNRRAIEQLGFRPSR